MSKSSENQSVTVAPSDYLDLKAGDMLKRKFGKETIYFQVPTAEQSLKILALYSRAAQSFQGQWEIEDGEPPEVTGEYTGFIYDLAQATIKHPKGFNAIEAGAFMWNGGLRDTCMRLAGLNNPRLADVEEFARMKIGDIHKTKIGKTPVELKMVSSAQGEQLRLLRPVGDETSQTKTWMRFADKLMRECVVKPKPDDWKEWGAPFFGALQDLVVVFAGVSFFQGFGGDLQTLDEEDIAILAGEETEPTDGDVDTTSGLFDDRVS